MDIEVSHAAADAESVVIARNPSVTHIVDGDQRDGRAADRVAQRQPRARPAPAERERRAARAVHAVRQPPTADGPIPSKSQQIFVGLERCPVIRPLDDGNDE